MPEEKSVSAIGRASATEREASSSEKFFFWLAPSQVVDPFDIIAAEQLEGSRTFGLVTNIRQITDAPSHLSNFISNDFGNVEEVANTPRQGANIAEVGVLANDRDIYMPVQSEAPVAFADEAGIHISLGIDKMPEEARIPAGLITMSNGTQARVYIDSRYVLGPEGAHVTISGISGLATKTSYGMFLIQSVLQTVGEADIAVVILNVKHNDLLVIDKPARGFTPEDHQLWEALGLKPQPFRNVRYFLPWGRDTHTTGLPNCFGEPPDQFQAFAYSLEDVIGRRDSPGPGLSLLIRVPDPWDTLGALIGEVQQGILNQESRWREVRTWDQLLNGPPLMENGIPKKFGEVAASSVGRFVRVLRRVTKNRQSGVFVQQRAPRRAVNLGEELRKIKGGQAFVVDIAKLTDEERALVFGHIIQEVYGMYAEATLDEQAELPRRVLLFVDELNKYAPAGRGQGDSFDSRICARYRG